jgi:hypothetical protein
VEEFEGALCAHVCVSKPIENASTLAAPKRVARKTFNTEMTTNMPPNFADIPIGFRAVPYYVAVARCVRSPRKEPLSR